MGQTPVTQPSPCPVCQQPAGFHAATKHQAHEVPAELTWKPGENPPWQREEDSVEPAHVKEDAAAVLSVLKGLPEENL